MFRWVLIVALKSTRKLSLSVFDTFLHQWSVYSVILFSKNWVKVSRQDILPHLGHLLKVSCCGLGCLCIIGWILTKFDRDDYQFTYLNDFIPV